MRQSNRVAVEIVEAVGIVEAAKADEAVGMVEIVEAVETGNS